MNSYIQAGLCGALAFGVLAGCEDGFDGRGYLKVETTLQLRSDEGTILNLTPLPEGGRYGYFSTISVEDGKIELEIDVEDEDHDVIFKASKEKIEQLVQSGSAVLTAHESGQSVDVALTYKRDVVTSNWETVRESCTYTVCEWWEESTGPGQERVCRQGWERERSGDRTTTERTITDTQVIVGQFLEATGSTSANGRWVDQRTKTENRDTSECR